MSEPTPCPGTAPPAPAPGPRYGLLLHPADPGVRVAAGDALDERLVRLGLAGAPFRCAGVRRRLAGERFLELLTFLGCSPFVHLTPPEGSSACESLDRFCHLAVHDAGEHPVLRRSTHAPAPRCPACRAAVADWQALAQSSPGAHWACPRCGAVRPVAELDWRQSAGFARTFLEVWGIHPGEAVPSDELLAALAGLSGSSWRWFYVTC